MFAVDLLRGHVGVRADGHAGRRESRSVHVPGDAEVAEDEFFNAGLSVHPKEQVGRFQISMDNAVFVSVVEGVTDLLSVLDNLLPRERAFAFQQFGQRAAAR